MLDDSLFDFCITLEEQLGLTLVILPCAILA